METEPRSTHGPEASFKQQQQQQQQQPHPSAGDSKKSNSTTENIRSPIWDPLVGPVIPNPKTKGFMSSGDREAFALNQNKDREIVVELGIIVDQEYLDKVSRDE